MTTNEKIALIQKTITDVLLVLADTTGPSPRSMIYLAVGMDMSIATIIESVMTGNGWVTCTSDTIRITAKGRELVQSCQTA